MMAINIGEYDGWAIKNDIENQQDVTEESAPENFFADILTGKKVSTSPKKLMVQKVMGQLFL